VWIITDPEFMRLIKQRIPSNEQKGNYRPGIQETIVPVVEVSNVLQTPTTERCGPLDINGQNAFGLTVPKGYRYRVTRVHKEGTSGNSYVCLNSGGTILQLTSSSTSSVSENCDITMKAGDQLGLTNSSNAGDGARYFNVHYLIEKVNE
jgi:hypothetical protein